MLIDNILVKPDLTPEQRLEAVAEVRKAFASSSSVSSFKSSSRSCQPENFHGTASDHGVTASSWLYGVQLYFEAEYTPDPVVKAVTYLHAGARRWWQQSSSQSMPASPTFADFSTAFLACYVKPSNSAAARNEIPYLRQTELVEAFSSHFRLVKSHITVGTPIDTPTLANYFVQGLNRRVSKPLAAHYSIDVKSDLELVIPTAEEMEAKLNLAEKQAHPSVAAINNSPERFTSKRGRQGAESHGRSRPVHHGHGHHGRATPYPNRGGGQQANRGGGNQASKSFNRNNGRRNFH